MSVTSARSKAVIKAEVENLRLEIMRLVRRKFTTRQIAAKTGLTVVSIQRHVRYVTRRMIAEQLDIAEELRDKAIADLEEAARAAWDAHEASGKSEHKSKWGYNEQNEFVMLEDTVTTRTPPPGHVANVINALNKIAELRGLIGKDEFQAPVVETPQFLRVVVSSREEVQHYHSIKMQQVKVIDGTATPAT